MKTLANLVQTGKKFGILLGIWRSRSVIIAGRHCALSLSYFVVCVIRCEEIYFLVYQDDKATLYNTNKHPVVFASYTYKDI